MRIALVVSGGFDRSGGERVTPALLWLSERLARSHDLSIYVLRYYREPCTYSLLGATIHDLGSPNGVARQHSALVAALRRDGPFDVIHGYLALPSGLAAVFAGRRLGVPVIVTMDSGEFVGLRDIDYGLQLRFRHRLAVKTVARLATKTTVSSSYQHELARSHGVRSIVVATGADRSRFPASATPALAEGPPWRLVHVASLNAVKDQATLLDALRHVHDAHLDVVGEDTLGGSVERYAARLGLTGRVTFHGFKPSETLARLYANAHLFVLSSRHEAANLAVVEAACCGLPSVGTHVGYLADWSPTGAATVPPQDPRALADAINCVLADSTLRRRLASAAHQWAVRHDADWTAARFEELYRDTSSRIK